MLKENDYIFSRVSIVLDFCVAAVAVMLAHLLRNLVLAPYIVPDIFRFKSRFADYWWLIILLPLLTVLLLVYNGYYKSQRVRSIRWAIGTIVLATFGASLAAIVISFIFTPRGSTSNILAQAFSGEFVSRGVLLMFPALATLLLSLKTLIVRSVLVELRNRGYNTRALLLVGNQEDAVKFLQHINSHPFWGFQITGLLSDPGSDDTEHPELTRLGNYDDLFPYLETHVVDDVVFLPGAKGWATFASLIRGCEEMGIRTRLPVHLLGGRISRPVLDNFDNIPVLTFNPVKEFGSALLFKHLFDRVVAAVMLLILSPIMAGVAIAIKLTSNSWKDPVLYRQTRCGLHGRLFTLYKFRSMRIDAESCRINLEEQNEMSGPVFKMRNDPRVTGVGRWIRKFSLDELPQFWNVLRGDMSLVGPRPPIPHEVAQYDRWQRRRLSMKPGITCIWQVSGRNQLSFDTWMKLDLEYIDNWSLGLDFKILCKTVYVVVTGYGAM